METVLITGGSGLVGTRLTGLLTERGYQVRHLSREPKPHPEAETYRWNIDKDFIDPRALEGLDHVIHLAGAPIADNQWSIDYKKEIVDSRVKTLEMLLRHLQSNGVQLKTLLSASASGFYGNVTTDHIFTEADSRGAGFLAKVCEEWEKTALDYSKHCRVAVLRTATVFSDKGGMLEKLAGIAKYHLGAALGSGKQWVPWVHIEDLCRMYLYGLQQPISGVYNACASQHITNKRLTAMLSKKLYRLYFLPNVPAFILRLIYGERAEFMLYGSRMDNNRIKSEGFTFQFPDLPAALDDLYKLD